MKAVFYVDQKMSALISPGRKFLALECAFLFIGLPLLMALHPTRGLVAPVLWGVTVYGACILHRMPGFSWREEWRGLVLSRRYAGLIAVRLIVSTGGVILLTQLIMPDGLFAFPRQRLQLWLIVMLLYPLLSALPQELLFRSFFFRRYADLFTGKRMLAASAAAFGFAHILFRNPVSPFLSLICGFFVGSSYQKHRSLKKIALEHALYGDMVFTVGLGVYFVLGRIS